MPKSIGVPKMPGAMVMLRMPLRAKSRAIGSVMPTTPAVIAVDSSILVSLLVDDAPSQAAKAKGLFDHAAEGGVAVWVSDTVLVELVWTLGWAYARDRRDIVKVLRALSAHGTVALELPSAARALPPMHSTVTRQTTPIAC